MGKRAYQSDQERKLRLLAQEVGLTRDERIELARYVLRRDIDSWNELDPAQVFRLLDQLEGYLLISALLAQRPPD